MSDFLIYQGQTPVFAWRRSFSPGDRIAMEEVFKTMGDLSGLKECNRSFTEWMSSIITPDFKIEYDSSDSAPTKRGGKARTYKKIKLESGRVQSSSTKEEAIAKLQHMHESIDPAADSIKKNPTGADVANALVASQTRPTPLALDPTGRASVPKSRAQLIAEEKAAQQSQGNNNQPDSMELQGGVVITRPKLDERGNPSVVIQGGTAPTETSADLEHQPGYQAKVVNGTYGYNIKTSKGKGRTRTAVHAAAEAKPMPLEDIIYYQDIQKALTNVSRCKDGNVLKKARQFCKDKGEQRIVDAIDVQLMKLGPLL